ncbi:hypothetical protein FHG87_009738 [Trinorchestia longiramus]|nr:hypothetical protein FHG87_009738 [Trinorchestia longiramus]
MVFSVRLRLAKDLNRRLLGRYCQRWVKAACRQQIRLTGSSPQHPESKCCDLPPPVRLMERLLCLALQQRTRPERMTFKMTLKVSFLRGHGTIPAWGSPLMASC